MGLWSTLFSTKKEDTDRAPVEANLRLQVYRPDCVTLQVLAQNGSLDAFAIRPLAPGLVQALVEDIGGKERVLRWEVARSLSKADDALFSLARTQAASTMGDGKVQSMDLDGDVQVMVSNDFYLSAVLLHSFAQANHKHGVLFAPLSWHHWVVHVVQGSTVPPTVAMMALIADNVRSQMRVADYELLSGKLYWWKAGGVIEQLELAGEGVEVHATSPELAKAMQAAFDAAMRR